MTTKEEVRRHALEVQQITKRPVLVTALFGSQNYGLATEKSDVDTRSLVARTVEDFILDKERPNGIHVFPDNSHAEYKDIHLFFETLRKHNPSFLEILFSCETIVSPLFQRQWANIIARREEIAHADPNRFYYSAFGLATQKYKNLCHVSPATEANIAKYGYDPKNLCHLIRMQFLVLDYANCYPLSECFSMKHSPEGQELCRKAKSGVYTLEEAKRLSYIHYELLKQKVDTLVGFKWKTHTEEINAFLDALLVDFYKSTLFQTLG